MAELSEEFLKTVPKGFTVVKEGDQYKAPDGFRLIKEDEYKKNAEAGNDLVKLKKKLDAMGDLDELPSKLQEYERLKKQSSQNLSEDYEKVKSKNAELKKQFEDLSNEKKKLELKGILSSRRSEKGEYVADEFIKFDDLYKLDPAATPEELAKQVDTIIDNAVNRQKEVLGKTGGVNPPNPLGVGGGQGSARNQSEIKSREQIDQEMVGIYHGIGASNIGMRQQAKKE